MPYHEMKKCMVAFIRDILDFYLAIHFLNAKGFLWSGRLHSTQIGFVGSITSLCLIYCVKN